VTPQMTTTVAIVAAGGTIAGAAVAAFAYLAGRRKGVKEEGAHDRMVQEHENLSKEYVPRVQALEVQVAGHTEQINALNDSVTRLVRMGDETNVALRDLTGRIGRLVGNMEKS